MRIFIMILVGFSLLYGEHFWTNQRGNNRQDGLSPCIGPREPVYLGKISRNDSTMSKNSLPRPIQWEPEVSSVINSDSTAYIYSGKTLLAIKNGQLLWREAFEEGTYDNKNICIDSEGMLYFPCSDHQYQYLLCYDPNERMILWKVTQEYGHREPKCLILSPNNNLYFMDSYWIWVRRKDTGDLLWSIRVPYNTFPAALGKDGGIYFSSTFDNKLIELKPDRTFIAIDKTYPTYPSIGKDGTIYVVYNHSSNNNKLQAFSPGLSLKWELVLDDPSINIAPCNVTSDNCIIVVSEEGYIHKISSDGAFIWNLKLPERHGIWATVDGEGKTYTCLEGFEPDDGLYCIDKNGKIVFHIPNTYEQYNQGQVIIAPARFLYILRDNYILVYQGKENFSNKETEVSLPLKLEIAPNPFKDRLTIKGCKGGKVYSISGKLMYEFKVDNQVINTESWGKGIYIVKTSNETRKIVKVN